MLEGAGSWDSWRWQRKQRLAMESNKWKCALSKIISPSHHHCHHWFIYHCSSRILNTKDNGPQTVWFLMVFETFVIIFKGNFERHFSPEKRRARRFHQCYAHPVSCFWLNSKSLHWGCIEKISMDIPSQTSHTLQQSLTSPSSSEFKLWHLFI